MNLHNAAKFEVCLVRISTHYGYDNQVFEKLPEEVDELQEAFIDYFKEPTHEHWLHIIEEAADVHIMIEQFKMLIKPEDKKEFDKICLEKVNREIGRIEAGGTK